jgi:uncharacterized protein YwgA
MWNEDMKASEKLEQSLKLVGVQPNIESFAERKRMQKLTYLLELFGVDLGFKFDWYLHGPYSTSLTKVLYQKDQREMNRDVQDNPKDSERIANLKKFLGSDIKSTDTLELIVSLHYLMALGKKHQKSDKEILRLFRKLKPFFSDEETEYYFKKIKEMLE